MVSVSISSELASIVQSGEDFDLEAKVRLARELYSSLRMTEKELCDEIDQVSAGISMKWSEYEIQTLQAKKTLIFELLRFLGFYSEKEVK